MNKSARILLLALALGFLYVILIFLISIPLPLRSESHIPAIFVLGILSLYLAKRWNAYDKPLRIFSGVIWSLMAAGLFISSSFLYEWRDPDFPFALDSVTELDIQGYGGEQYILVEIDRGFVDKSQSLAIYKKAVKYDRYGNPAEALWEASVDEKPDENGNATRYVKSATLLLENMRIHAVFDNGDEEIIDIINLEQELLQERRPTTSSLRA